MGQDFIKVQGKEFVKAGAPIMFHGLGIGSWLNLEHFMLGLPTTDSQIRAAVAQVLGKETAEEFFHAFTENFVTEQDFQFLKECGINLIRVPFNYRLFLDDQAPEALKPEGFAILDRLMDLCERYGIYLLPDLHAVPGGENPDWHSDNSTGIPQFWHYKLFRQQMVKLWEILAGRWKNRACILGYDLLNEPWLMDAPKELLNSFYCDAIAAIRRVDQQHIIFLEGDNFAMDFDCITEIPDANTALTFHYYPTVWNADLLSGAYGREKRRQVFKDILIKLASIREEFRRPVLCGEAGYEIDKAHPDLSLDMLEDTLDLFDEAEISWTVWCYKDAQFMGLCYPKTGTPWMELAKKLGAYWSQDIEKAQANRVMDELVALPGLAEAETTLKYHMHFRQRGILYRFQLERLLKPALRELTREQLLELPNSFLFENCAYHQRFAELIKTHG